MTAQDEAFFTTLYCTQYPRLLRIANRMLHSIPDAEDLTNEAFAILLTHLARVRQHPNPVGWLYTVLLRRVLDELRRQRCHTQVPLEYARHISSEEESDLSLLAILPNTLSQTDKEILYLRYQLNLNCVEIAELLHIRHDACRTRLSRAKRHCAQAFSAEKP